MLHQVPIPPREVDHKARFDGWNLQVGWRQDEAVWNGSSYDVVPIDQQTVPKPGLRPLTVFVCAEGGDVYLQFIERHGALIGDSP